MAGSLRRRSRKSEIIDGSPAAEGDADCAFGSSARTRMGYRWCGSLMLAAATQTPPLLKRAASPWV
ncbi:hypothetical protein KCP75_13080 [Salmonella enterica subsp. enterica]|nr:hypothetical protein KCP75_13080 [Salmonella enterica subsp. enterica]